MASVAHRFDVVAPVHPYLRLISLRFSTSQLNLLTIPWLVIFLLYISPSKLLLMKQLLFWTWLSEQIPNSCVYVTVFCQIWSLPFLIGLVVVKPNANPWVRFVLLTLLCGYSYIHTIQVALQSRNANSVRTRTAASTFDNMMVQLGNIFSFNIYDASYYYRGNKVLIALCCMNSVIVSSN